MDQRKGLLPTRLKRQIHCFLQWAVSWCSGRAAKTPVTHATHSGALWGLNMAEFPPSFELLSLIFPSHSRVVTADKEKKNSKAWSQPAIKTKELKPVTIKETFSKLREENGKTKEHTHAEEKHHSLDVPSSSLCNDVAKHYLLNSELTKSLNRNNFKHEHFYSLLQVFYGQLTLQQKVFKFWMAHRQRKAELQRNPQLRQRPHRLHGMPQRSRTALAVLLLAGVLPTPRGWR